MKTLPSFRLVLALLAAALAVSFSGCSAVYVAKPVGEKPHPLKPEDWNGTWAGGEDSGAITVHVTDAAKGRLAMASVKMRDNKFVLEGGTAEVRANGETLFISVRGDDDQEERYLFARIKIDGGQVAIWCPEPEKFRAWVRSGALPGRVDKSDDVALDALPAAKVAEFAAKNSEAFDWEHPLMLHRISK